MLLVRVDGVLRRPLAGIKLLKTLCIHFIHAMKNMMPFFPLLFSDIIMAIRSYAGLIIYGIILWALCLPAIDEWMELRLFQFCLLSTNQFTGIDWNYQKPASGVPTSDTQQHIIFTEHNGCSEFFDGEFWRC